MTNPKTALIGALRARQAAEFLGIGLSTFWRWNKERPDFPKSVKIGTRTTVWRLEDIQRLLDQSVSKPVYTRPGTSKKNEVQNA